MASQLSNRDLDDYPFHEDLTPGDKHASDSELAMAEAYRKAYKARKAREHYARGRNAKLEAESYAKRIRDLEQVIANQSLEIKRLHDLYNNAVKREDELRRAYLARRERDQFLSSSN